jgi:hypothetical protein
VPFENSMAASLDRPLSPPQSVIVEARFRVPSRLALTACLSGCMALPIPHERAVTPVIEGVISDARTGAPIGGAMIRATPDVGGGGEYEGNLVTTTATSDEQGRFRVLATEKAQWMYVLLLLEGGCRGKYVVTKDGYRPLTLEPAE